MNNPTRKFEKHLYGELTVYVSAIYQEKGDARLCICVLVYLCICVFVYLCICVFVYLSICEEGGDNGCDQLSGSTRVGENLPAAATAPEIWQNFSTFSPCSENIQVQKRTDSPGTKSSAKSIGIYVVTTTSMSKRHYFGVRL